VETVRFLELPKEWGEVSFMSPDSGTEIGCCGDKSGWILVGENGSPWLGTGIDMITGY
jgi:hypothetical protein